MKWPRVHVHLLCICILGVYCVCAHRHGWVWGSHVQTRLCVCMCIPRLLVCACVCVWFHIHSEPACRCPGMCRPPRGAQHTMCGGVLPHVSAVRSGQRRGGLGCRFSTEDAEEGGRSGQDHPATPCTQLGPARWPPGLARGGAGTAGGLAEQAEASPDPSPREALLSPA